MQPRYLRLMGMVLCCLPVLFGGDGTRTLAADAPSDAAVRDTGLSNDVVAAMAEGSDSADDTGWQEAFSPTLRAQYLAAVLNEDCQLIGQPSQFLTDRQGPTYWGNTFTILRDSILTDFEIELTLFDDPTPLHFSIYRASTPEDPADSYGFRELEPVFIGAPIDASPFGDAGNEQPAFYAAALPTPITLHAGFDYVLAVAWGPEFVELHNDREDVTYPKSLEGNDGKTLGVTVESSVTLPLDPGALISPTVFDFYALSMNLCLEPQPGACCVGGLCEELKPDECIPDNIFTRERLTCEDLVTVEEMDCPLPTWACCLPGGTCLRLDKFACEVLDGTWQRDSLCGDFPDPCAPIGGCCKAGGTCEVITEDECKLVDGLYRGDDTTCGTFCATGACCGSDASCAELTISDCSLNRGAWRGHGSRCATDGSTCDPRGACCNGTTCLDGADGMTETVCLAGDGLYQGDWTTCDTLDVACGKGACCTPVAGCRPNLSRSVCEISWSGIYKGDGSDCATVATECFGTCCDSGFCLPSITPVDCSASGTGVFVGYNLSCFSDPCAGVVTSEACCFPDGVCAEVPTAADCTAFSGVAQGVATCSGVTCADAVIGACCLGGDSCAELTAADCGAESGSYVGDGTACSLSACGVCCRGDGECDDTLDLDACAAIAGLCVGGFNDGAACNAPGDCLGLCDDGFTTCTSDADCTAPEICNEYGVCDAVFGLFFPGEDCASPTFSCPPTGACCVAGQPCLADVTLHACDRIGGFWVGTGSSCATPDLCVPKRCCHDDGSCTVALATQCAVTGGVTVDGFFDCVTEPLCPDAWACCHDDGTCTMVTEQACLEAGGASHPGEECGVSDTCPPPGRCCLPDETCDDLTEEACQSQSGLWDGRFACTSPTDSSCRRGACCRIDGTCEDVIGSECTAEAEDFVSGDCATRSPCIPAGACCTDFDCALATEEECIGGGGCYLGDGLLCDGPTCTQGVVGFSILEADPPAGTRDARMPHALDDKNTLFTWNVITLTLDGTVANDICLPAFKIAEVGGDGTPPEIIDVQVLNETTVELTLSERLEPGAWIKITHANTADEYCLAVLPGDVGRNLVTDVADIGALVACLNAPMHCGGVGTGTPCTSDDDCGAPGTCLPVPCDPLLCDLDRGGACTGADLAMLINLLNGAGELDSWDGKTLDPSPCP